MAVNFDLGRPMAVAEQCPARQALDLISDRWTMIVFKALSDLSLIHI